MVGDAPRKDHAERRRTTHLVERRQVEHVDDRKGVVKVRLVDVLVVHLD